MRHALAIACLVLAAPAWAQRSASFEISEHVFNDGGGPPAATSDSPSFRIALSAVGRGITSPPLSGPTYSMDLGLASGYRPPGEVREVRFLADKTTLVWAVERSVGDYRVYRGLTASLPGGYGECRLAAPAESASLPEVPDFPGAGFFYLVTARNRLQEEGDKGSDSAGRPRGNPAPCP